MLCSENNDIDHIRERIINSLEGQVKISLNPILHRPSAKTHFPLEFKVIFLFILYQDLLSR
jgi:hypothetical protein